ncbi:glycosyltransferase family 8 protein [Plicaturopsis crispa FD-325 SS-3]|nr:glycosyltransferase family 8 protein [Plicaturopsis crispa FD-325 SS-3]
MAIPFAFVTLVTSDFYLPGALALAGALKDVHTTPPTAPEVDFQTVCIVTPETVDVSTIKLLRRAFDSVIGVEVIAQEDDAGLKLLGRPDLNTVLTKLHVFRLTQYSKIIFLDADVLPVRPLSHLFTLPDEFSAVPDVGWPDIFNSGVMVLSPGEDKFTELNGLLKSKGSWDGGDQGLLNEWRGGNWNRLSFTYNTTPTAAYTYAPAYERFGSKISAIHFIGPKKPWSSIPYRAPEPSKTQPSEIAAPPDSQQAYDYGALVDRWFDVYDRHYRAEAVIPQTDFEVHRYVSAWDEPTVTGVELTTSGLVPPGGVLGLEDLRRIALEGMGASISGADGMRGEGEYHSMPLEGRVDLMRPRKEVTEPASEPDLAPEPESQPGPQSDSRPRLRFDDQPRVRFSDFSEHSSGDYGSPSTPMPQHSQTHSDSPRWQTLPTPGPNEVPPAPQPSHRTLFDSGPPTPTPPPHHGHQSHNDESKQPQDKRMDVPQHEHYQPKTQQHVIEVSHNEHSQQFEKKAEISHHEHYEPDPQPQLHSAPSTYSERPRPPSPPLLSWNPAIEPPPTTTPAVSAFPTDTYFPNIWDQTPSQRHDETHQSFPSADNSSTHSNVFFSPPPPSEIPEQLLRQGHYRNVTGPLPENGPIASPSPDASKVKRVFPWEEKARQPPGRVFPLSDATPPALIFAQKSESSASSVAPSTPERSASESLAPAPVLSPTKIIGLPTSLTYANAWDNIPSIQKYASRLVRPTPPPIPLSPAFEGGGRRRRKGSGAAHHITSDSFRSWDDQGGVSSMDADVEDEGDDEDTELPPSATPVDDGDSSSGTPRRASRAGSMSPKTFGRKDRKYRTQGVQTIPKPTRSQAVQVTITAPPAKRAGSASPRGPMRSPPRGTSSIHTQQWRPATSTLSPVLLGTAADQMATASPALHAFPGPSASPLSLSPPMVGPRSPREFAYSPAHSPDKLGTPLLKLSSPMPPRNLRKLSDETSSSASPLSPPGSQQLSPSTATPRKAARVFDPARGVDVFKRGSEEVLARFLKMGSWEEEANRKR